MISTLQIQMNRIDKMIEFTMLCSMALWNINRQNKEEEYPSSKTHHNLLHLSRAFDASLRQTLTNHTRSSMHFVISIQQNQK